MIKKYLFIFFLFSGAGAFAQTVSVKVTAGNQTISGSDYFFDIFLEATANGPLYLGTSDFIFTYDETQFTTPVISEVTPATTYNSFVPNVSAQAAQCQANYYNNLDESLDGSEIRINLNLPYEPADQTGFNENIAEIDGTLNTHRLGRFKISGVNASDVSQVALAWKSSGSGLVSQVYHFDNSGSYFLKETNETFQIESGVKLSAKAYLQGPYSGGTMSDALRSGGLIPTSEPYAGLGFTHVCGGGNEETTSGVLSVTGNDAIVDWVFLELRDKNASSTVLHTRSALIQKDGDIVDIDGTSPVTFGLAPDDDYFVAVRHRNHLGVMSSAVMTLSGTAAAIDFSSVATYGTNAQKDLGGSVMGMWAGNANNDGFIKYNGASNDKNSILFSVGLLTPNNIINGYFSADVNMDGNIKYNGASNDKNAILFNVGLFTPNNIITQQLP